MLKPVTKTKERLARTRKVCQEKIEELDFVVGSHMDVADAHHRTRLCHPHGPSVSPVLRLKVAFGLTPVVRLR